MAKVSLHNHTVFSDGKASVEAMVQAAYEKGFTHFGIADHVRNPSYAWQSMPVSRYDAYIASIQEQKERYRGRMHVYVSLETDYYYRCPFPPQGETRIDQVRAKLDYLVGSVHFLTCDGSHCLSENHPENLPATARLRYNGDVHLLVEAYYDAYAQMLSYYRPEVCAHLDVVKLNNKGLSIFDENSRWYRCCVQKTLCRIKACGGVLELNYGPLSRYGSGFVYPSAFVLSKAREMDIPVTLSADAHDTRGIDQCYAQAAALLKRCGYANVWVPGDDGEWCAQEIDS